MNRDEAIALLREHVRTDTLFKHCLATEAIMRSLARKLGKGEETWGVVGLLHDLDFDDTKDEPTAHGLKTAEVLKEQGLPDELIHTIKTHNGEALGLERQTEFEHALACAETITGLVVATALVYPDKKLASVKAKSITKRMKEKAFARNVNRDTVRECEKIGLTVPEFAQLSLVAMQGISDELGL